MAKQLNVNLSFTADTSKARSQLQDLQNQLSKLTSAPAQQLNLKWTEQIQQATVAAMELKTHLSNATNIQTGALDFTKLNASIKASGKNLAEYGRQLQSLGPAGQQAFISLANAVAQSEIPIRRSNVALQEMMTTLKNTARWQLSSSMLHGFMGAVQSAYGYAQDLNESLNNIRIVTDKNIEQMAKFAEQANKAAKALSTTTTEYTNASLIYYQQGLNDSEVAKRTDITVKMANAAGQSAQIVSDQLTSVWNNFYDGSKSLEYYADVMTALGAATASSTDEIAGGLEKFAAVADTIGLSYEYAASALATITSNTRQSEEVVGTALKTIFARIQGLNLGETLEDGTTLNKYSEALQKVGISIFESNGEIKKMDNILDEMAIKWQTLAKDQQIALAQTVAGVRQYNQLVSLMDNWNSGDGDSMAANLKTAYGATGSLQKQADIYAESWEAAQDRVRAAAEGLFDSLIDEDFFIGLLNGLEDVLTFIEKTVDAVGGLKGVLAAVSVVMTKMFSEQMAQGLRNMAHNIYMSTEGGRQAMADEKLNQMRQMRKDMSLGQDGIGSEVGDVANKQFEQQLSLQEQLMLNSQNMSESEIANAQQLLDLRKQIGDEVVKAKQAEIDAKEKIAKARDQAFMDMGAEADNNDGILGIETTGRFEELQAKLKMVSMTIGDTKQALQSMGDTMEGELDTTAISKITDAFRHGLGSQLGMSKKEIKNFFRDIEKGGETANAALKNLMDRLQSKSGGIQGTMNKELGVGKSAAREMAQGYEQMSSSAYQYKTAAERAAEAQKLVEQRIKNAKGVVKDWANSIVSGAQAVMSFVSIINTAKSAIDTLTNPDMSGWEKFFAVLQSGAMIITMMVSMFNSFAQAQKNWQAGTLKNAAATLIEAAAASISAAANRDNAKANMKSKEAHEADADAALKDAAANEVEALSEEKNKNGNGGGKNPDQLIDQNKKLKDSFNKLKDAAGKWFKTYKTQIGAYAIMAAGIAVAIGAISWGINQYNKFENAAKDAAKKAEEASTAYQAVSTAYDQFTSNLSAYEDAHKGLKDLTKGTLEYEEAVLKANESAMELIKTYKDIDYTVDSDGLIIINETSLQAAKEAQLEILKNAQRANLLMQQNATNKQLEADMVQFQRDSLDSGEGRQVQFGNGLAAAGAGALSGALVGGGIGGAAGGGVFSWATAGIGALVGAAIGAITGVAGVISGSAAKEEEAVLNRLADVYENSGNAKFASDAAFEKLLRDELQIDDELLIQSLTANRTATLDLVKEVAANNQILNAQNTAKVKDVYGEDLKKTGLDQESQDAIASMMGTRLGELTEKLYDDEFEDQFLGKTDAEVQKAYAEAMGWATDTIENQTGNKAKYYDKSGKEIGVISDEVARRYLAEQKALQQLENSTQGVVDKFKELTNSVDVADQALLEFLKDKNFQDLSKTEYDALYAQVANQDGDAEFTKNDVIEYINQEFGNGSAIDDQTAQQYGYANAQAFYDSFFDRFSSYLEDRDNIDSNLTKYAQNIVDSLGSNLTDAMSTAELGKMSKHINDAVLASGEEAAAFVANNIYAKAGEEAGDLAEVLDTINWNDVSASELSKTLEDAGISTQFTTNELNTLIDIMSVDALMAIDALAEKIKSLNALTKLSQGDTITADQFDALSGELQSYFTLMADGTYKLTQDALDFYQAVNGEIKNTLKTQAELQAVEVGTNMRLMERDRDYYLSNATLNDTRLDGIYNMSYQDYFNSQFADYQGYDAAGNPVQLVTYSPGSGYNHSIDNWTTGESLTLGLGEGRTYTETVGGSFTTQTLDNGTRFNLRVAERDANGNVVTTKRDDGYEYINYVDVRKDVLSEDAWYNSDATVKGSAAWERANAERMTLVTDEQKQLLGAQLELLGQSEWGKSEEGASQLYDWNAALEAGTLNMFEASKIFRQVEEHGMATLDTIEANAAGEQEKLQNYYNQLFMTAQSASEREEMLQEALTKGVPEDVANNAYANAAQAAINEEKWENMDVAAVETYSNHIQSIANSSELIADNIGEEAAEEVALYVQKMNQGIEKLANGYEEWNDILKKSDKSSHEYAEAMTSMKDAMSDVLGTSEEFIDDDFIIKHLDKIEKAAKGDAEAIDALKVALAEDILCNIVAVSNIDEVSQEIKTLHDSIVGWDTNISVGTTLETGDFITAANELVRQAGMTVDQAQAYFNSLGYEPTFVTEKKTVPLEGTRTYTENVVIGEKALNQGGATVPFQYIAQSDTRTEAIPMGTQEIDVPALSGDGTPTIKSLTKTSAGAMNNRSGANPGGKKGGGGGGGSKKPAEKPKKSDIVERYKEINDLIDDLADKMNDASKAANRLYGKGRLDMMKKNNELLQQEIELTKKKKEEALKYLDEDRQAMFDAAKDAGVMLNVDSSGLITNYTEAMTELYNDLKDATDQANKDGEVSDAEQEKLDLIQERIDNLKDAIGQYDDTRELLEDLDNELTEKFYQWQDNNYEILTYELEIKIELNDDEMKLVDYYLSKISDDFYSMAEAAALMVDSTSSMTGASQLDLYNSNLENYANHMAELERAYAAGEISQAAYVEGLREVQEGTLNNLQALNDLDKSMMEYYGNTLAMAGEEIAKYTDRMEHQTSVLDHYQSLMETMGKSTDYKTMGKVLEGKAKTIGDQVAVAKETMKMYQDEADERYLAYQTALASGDQAAAEMYLKQYEDALAAANEAEEEYLNSAEEWAEALRAVLENKLSDLGQTLENALTGGTSFDQMTTSLQRAQSLQEEYLTTTNKIYETNKLMRTAQQEIDKTNNSIAKQRLKSFIQETNQLQNKNKLSQYELQIQQAKYDLLLAEIALDEAQAAKSTVRLQRDNEGNFGYVYTADRAAVSAAEQEMLDKQNSLYNIALDGANDYAQKYQSTLNEMYDTLTDLQQQYLAGAFESEAEYHAAVESAKQYYYEKLQQYSELHTIAITTDNRVVVEAWSAGFNEMIGSTDTWMVAVNNYVSQVSLAFSTWKGEMEIIAKDVGVDLGSIEGSIKNVTDESDDLRKAIIGEDGNGGVVQALKNELQAVKDVTAKYATLRGSLDSVKQGYEALAAAINAVVAAQSKISNATPPPAPSYTPGSGGGNGNAGDGSGSGNGSGGGGGGNGGGGGGQTEKSVSITLYAARNTNARMGTHTVKSNTKIYFGTATYYSENSGTPMVYASGGGWSGYVTEEDRDRVRTAFGFDTGGYTGDWSGSYGKLAFLHQKELVLNQGDTENFLASMQILERILQVIDLQSASSQIGGILSAPRFNMNNTDTLEQNVHIEASFPGITEHNELEQAFNNLVNQAAQYANR